MPKLDILNKGRVRKGDWSSDDSFGFTGAFEFKMQGEFRTICVIASDLLGWQHVSVSFGHVSDQTPSWEVMCFVKDLFWEPEDVVIQIHPAKKDYVNYHPGCLHLWRCIDGREQPVPLSIMVGPKGS